MKIKKKSLLVSIRSCNSILSPYSFQLYLLTNVFWWAGNLYNATITLQYNNAGFVARTPVNISNWVSYTETTGKT